MSDLAPFHLAFPVADLDATRAFYAALGCAMGRSSDTWQDFSLFGHQLSAHLAPAAAPAPGLVDGKTVPIPHFGVVLTWADWQALAARVTAAGIAFHVAPAVRFEGLPGEQGTFFLRDPSGNTLEFKGFRDMAQVFA